jgi:pilus assembly protein CpaB
MLIRRNESGGGKGGTTDVVLQNAPVLAIDQLADERSDKPMIVKAVTLEVDTVAAQKLTLSAQLGILSLALRKAGEATVAESRRISATDIGRGSAPAEGRKNFSTVTVTRASERKDYSVPSEGSGEWNDAGLASSVATQ